MPSPIDHYRQSARAAFKKHTGHEPTTGSPTIDALTAAAEELVIAELTATTDNCTDGNGEYCQCRYIQDRIAALTKENQQ